MDATGDGIVWIKNGGISVLPRYAELSRVIYCGLTVSDALCMSY